jgi:hypothetical protein
VVKPLNDNTELFNHRLLQQIAMNGGVSESYSYKKSRLKHSKNEFDALDDIVIDEKLD